MVKYRAILPDCKYKEWALFSAGRERVMQVLKVENVKKSFRGDMSLGRREVLHGVSLAAEAGQVLGFLGPNGAGKTTTIKIILGLIRPDSGSVRIFDRPVGERAVMSRIGYLPETPNFYPHLSLREFLVFCGRLSGMGGGSLSRRVEEVMEIVGLGSSGGDRLKGFSKGMIQRAGLAQAILHGPDFLVLDEPFSGLDPLGRVMVRDILIDLKNSGRTIFFSSHILPDMEALCDRTCIIREGEIVRCIGLDELIRIGEGKVEITARGCSADCIESLKDYIDSENTAGEETFLVVRAQGFVRHVIKRLYESNAEVLKVVNQHPTLENVFLDEILGGKDIRRITKHEKELMEVGS